MDAHAGRRARVTRMGGLYDAATLRALMCKVRTFCVFADIPSRRIQNARRAFTENATKITQQERRVFSCFVSYLDAGSTSGKVQQRQCANLRRVRILTTLGL